MAADAVIWIVVAVIAAIVLIAVLVLLTRRQRTRQAQNIREQVHAETAGVDKREAFADETVARARRRKPRQKPKRLRQPGWSSGPPPIANK